MNTAAEATLALGVPVRLLRRLGGHANTLSWLWNDSADECYSGIAVQWVHGAAHHLR
jgi:hypothetical protein